jgi:hypothetical protein
MLSSIDEFQVPTIAPLDPAPPVDGREGADGGVTADADMGEELEDLYVLNGNDRTEKENAAYLYGSPKPKVTTSFLSIYEMVEVSGSSACLL